MSNQENRAPRGIGQYLGQIVGYAIFAVILGYFSASPDWRYFPADKALIKLSFTHAGQRKEACKDRTAHETRNIPNSAKIPKSCPRERHPVHVKLWLNDAQVYAGTVNPSGLSKDGPSQFYETFQVPPGNHTLALEVRDHGLDKPGFRHVAKAELRNRDILAIDLDRSALLLRLPSR
jgi:hypothetical protein